MKKIKIDTNSWHYKFVKKNSKRIIPTNLCPYVRLLLLCILQNIGIFFLIGMVILVALAFCVMLFAGFFLSHEPFIVYVSMSLWIITATTILSTLRTIKNDENPQHFLFKEVFKFSSSKLNVSKRFSLKDSIFYHYIKAVHGKVCPSIEFETKTETKE